MKVTRDKKGEADSLKKIKAWLNKRPRSDKGWHVSDLLYLRKSFWRKVKPLPMTDKEALFFITGHGHHNVLEAILGPKQKLEGKSDAGEFLKHGILFSPDMRFKAGPVEIKTSRAMYIKADEGEDPRVSYKSYLKQEGSYQALLESRLGKLLVLFLGAVTDKTNKWKKTPQLRQYNVEIEPAEQKVIVASLKQRSKDLTAAVKKKSCKDLPLCEEWLCRDCGWFKECKPWLVDSKRKGLQDAKK